MKPFLLITGMHRSGTSFLARALNLCGVYLGGIHSLSTHDWNYVSDNLRGHWEHEKLKELADETLSNSGGAWDKNPEKIILSEETSQKLKHSIDELYKFPSIASGFKDPRIILCYDAWKEFFPSGSVIIGIFRDPLKVAESLKNRNQFNYDQSLSLWNEYNTVLLELIEKNSGFLLNFDWPQKKMFSEINLIAKKLSLVESDLSNWYSSELLHSDKTFVDFDISDYTKSLYDKLKIRSEKNSEVDVAFSERFSSEFFEILKGMITDSEELGNYFRNANEENLERIHTIFTELSTTKNSLESTESDLNKLQNLHMTQQKQIDSLHTAIKDKDKQIDFLSATLNNLKEKPLRLENKIQQKQEEIKNLNNAVESYQNLITDIHQSFVFRALHKYDKTIGKVLPLRPKKFLKSMTRYQSPNEQKNIISSAIPPKLEKKDILSFPIINWDFRYQRPQHILSQFAKAGHRIFYFTVNLRPLQMNYEIKQIQENIFQVELNSPSFFDIYKDTFNHEYIDKISESFEKLQIDLKIDAIQHVQFPTWAELSLKLKNRYNFKIIFDCLDDFVGFDNVIDERIKEEETLFSNSDLVLASSSHLIQKTMKFTNNYLFLPNACEFDHFNQNPYSEILSKYPKPIIGYFGSIANWFDTDLLEYVAKSCPDYSFVMVGHTSGSDIRKLKNLKNIHFLGERPYSQLPKYLHNFDVCLIPFKKTPLIHATHPIKIYEYMAAGKPVVATDMPELYPMAKLCYVSTTKEDFFANIKKAVNETDKNLPKERIEFAASNTWKDRFDKLYDNLSNFEMNHHN